MWNVDVVISSLRTAYSAPLARDETKLRISLERERGKERDKYSAWLTIFAFSFPRAPRSALRCSALLCSAVLRSTLLRSAPLRSAPLCSIFAWLTLPIFLFLVRFTLLCSALLYFALFRSVLLRSTPLHSAYRCVFEYTTQKSRLLRIERRIPVADELHDALLLSNVCSRIRTCNPRW